jgi:predicted RNA-binding protein with TRAM domain
LRLRDIGGIIVIDFIDMARARNRDAVMKTLRKALDEDRTKTFTAEISKLGLVEMTRQNVTEGVREIMSRPCPTCEGEGVIRSEETYAIEFERRLRDIAVETPDVEAFLVQINPRVTAEFTGHGSRVLHALEAETGKSFLFEGSEGLTLEHFAITFQGTRAEVEERALPFRQGDEVLVEIVEPHMYDVDDAVAKIDGYIISIAGAAPCVGEKRMVRIDQVGRTAASALLLDESGEVVRPTPRPSGTRGRGGAGRGSSRRSGGEPPRDGGRPPVEPSKSRSRGRRAPAESVDAEARREAGLSESPTAIDAEPEEEQVRDTARQAAEPVVTPGLAASDADEPQGQAADGPTGDTADGPTQDAAQDPAQGDGGEEQAERDEDVQSKPRRRGRRGGRRRSAAKAQSSTD